MKGTIFDIKHYAIHDGPGIRQTIFFKGCPLSCWWCHNPESRSKEVLVIEKEETLAGEKFCVTETIGKEYSVDQLMEIIVKDIPFFEESGGGVTLSGGEPLLQYDFAYELLTACREHEIHTCVDTTGYVSEEKLIKISDKTDLFLFDVKHMDDEEHRRYTGVSNAVILKNLRLLDQIGADIWIRFPLIPGVNDDEYNVLRMLEVLTRFQKKYPVTILPYHKIGKHKYDKFGIKYNMTNINEPHDNDIENTTKLFIDAGFNVKIGG